VFSYVEDNLQLMFSYVEDNLQLMFSYDEHNLQLARPTAIMMKTICSWFTAAMMKTNFKKIRRSC